MYTKTLWMVVSSVKIGEMKAQIGHKYLYFSHLLSDLVAIEYSIQCCLPVSFTKMWRGKAIPFLLVYIKLHLCIYHKTLWYFGSKPHVYEVCVLHNGIKSLWYYYYVTNYCDFCHYKQNTEELSLLRCDALSLHKWLQMFQRIVMLFSSKGKHCTKMKGKHCTKMLLGLHWTPSKYKELLSQ